MDHYQRALEDLFVRTTQGIKLGLDSTIALLDALGRPDHTTANVLVAGTNGKGSTSSLLAHALQGCGYRVGLYTSPHLLRYTERIRIDGQELEREQIVDLYETIVSVEHLLEQPPTFFEATTAMAMLAFSRANLDFAILEVGLGGRLDSTNAAKRIASVITPIALDHCHLLGSDLASIAAEKAGIIGSDTPIISAPQAPEAMHVIEATAKAKNAQIYLAPGYARLGTELKLAGSPIKRPVHLRNWHRPDFQAANVSTVATALEALADLGYRTQPQILETEHESWSWPGRFQKLPGSPTVILDGAHNPAAMDVLAKAVVEAAAAKPVHVVFSAIGTKDLGTMLGILNKIAKSIRLTPSTVHKSLTTSEFRALQSGHLIAESHEAAIDEARTQALGDGGLVLVTGSLFLVADALHLLTGASRDMAIAS